MKKIVRIDRLVEKARLGNAKARVAITITITAIALVLAAGAGSASAVVSGGTSSSASPSAPIAPAAPMLAGTQWEQDVAYNSASDEYLVVWFDQRNGSDSNVYGQRVSNTGTLVGSEIPISTAAGNQDPPVVAYNNTLNEYLVVWADARLGFPNIDLYGQRVSSTGSLVGSEFPISTVTERQTIPEIAYNSIDNEYLVTWRDQRNGQNFYYIYGQRVSGNGALAGSEIAIDTAGNAVASRPSYNSTNNEYLIVWGRTGDAYGQRLSNTGGFLGGNFVISAAPGDQQFIDATYNSVGNEYLVVWSDDRNTHPNYDVYGQRVSGTGGLSGGEIPISTAANEQRPADVTYNSASNEYLVIWSDARTGAYDIYGQRVSGTGSLSGGEIPISTDSAAQVRPAVASGGNQYLAAWGDLRNGTDNDVWGQRVSNTGALSGGNFNITPGEPVATATSTSTETATATDTATDTATSTSTSTSTPSFTATSTETPTATNTETSTSTSTETSTATSTETATSTSTETPTETSTETATATSTETPTATSTETATSTSTETSTATSTTSSTATQTDIPTQTNTPTSTLTVTPSTTSTGTSTTTYTSTPTGTGTSTRTSTSTATATATTMVTATACEQFPDVEPGDTFYVYINCMVCQYVITGFPDGTFRAHAQITRGQIAKIVSQAAGFSEDPGEQTYADVPPGSPFYAYINRLTNRGIVGGYPCPTRPDGGDECTPENPNLFEPNANATRGQLAKIVSNAAGFNEAVSGQHYADVPASGEGSQFYTWIMRLTNRDVMGGYPCGTQDSRSGACDGQNRPYFRPGANVTRGQSSKIVANTFFPNCQTP
jgi:hypothetical protein